MTMQQWYSGFLQRGEKSAEIFVLPTHHSIAWYDKGYEKGITTFFTSFMLCSSNQQQHIVHKSSSKFFPFDFCRSVWIFPLSRSVHLNWNIFILIVNVVLVPTHTWDEIWKRILILFTPTANNTKRSQGSDAACCVFCWANFYSIVCSHCWEILFSSMMRKSSNFITYE